jgi:hypothetical protein
MLRYSNSKVKEARERSSNDQKVIQQLKRKLKFYENHTNIRPPKDLDNPQELEGSFVFEEREASKSPKKVSKYKK